MLRRPAAALALFLTCCAGTPAVFAQGGVYAYPIAGQDEQTQARDRFDCHQWAVTQSGFDPTTAAPLPPPQYAQQPPPPPPPQYQQPRQNQGSILGIGNGGMFQGGGMLGDAATGAALGAAGGAIAGDAGEGAAIGAMAGTLFGALTRSTQQPQVQNNDYQYQQQQQYYQQQQAQQDQVWMQRQEQQAGYKRAYGACMSARNYTVQ